MSKSWQQFLCALIVQLALPLMPLLIEFWITGTISDKTYSISAAMYAISIGVTTKNIGLLGLGIFAGMAFSSAFGFVTSGNAMRFSVSLPALATIVAFMIIHAAERYRRHVTDGEAFLEFGDRRV